MRKIAILVFCLALAGCTKVETVSNNSTQTNLNSTQTNSNKIAAVSPTIENEIFLKPVKLDTKFNAKQQKYLDKSLPPEVREILEKAEKFELLAKVLKEGETERDTAPFEPNRIAKIIDEKEKKEILEVFYKDAATDDIPYSCYQPHHGIRAVYQGKIVEIEICFDCARFHVKSEFGKFEGAFAHESKKSENIFKKIVESKSIELKQ